MKSQPEKAEKFSIKAIEPLIDSIIRRNPDLNEETICLNLGYNGGYISQLRSREKATGDPQVSPKFYKQLETYGLQNAKYAVPDHTSMVADDSVPYTAISGQWKEGKDQFITALLEEKDRAIKKAEEHYKDAKADKERLFTALDKLQTTFDETLKQISENLKVAATNLKSNHDVLVAIGRTVRANDAEMMEALDHLEGNPVGTRQNRSHTVQKALREGAEASVTDKKTGKGKIHKDVS